MFGEYQQYIDKIELDNKIYSLHEFAKMITLQKFYNIKIHVLETDVSRKELMNIINIYLTPVLSSIICDYLMYTVNTDFHCRFGEIQHSFIDSQITCSYSQDINMAIRKNFKSYIANHDTFTMNTYNSSIDVLTENDKGVGSCCTKIHEVINKLNEKNIRRCDVIYKIFCEFWK